MQESQAQSLVWEDSTCRGATKPACHNYWGVLQSLCPATRDAPARRSPCTATRESLHEATKAQYGQKLINKWNFRGKKSPVSSLSAIGGHSEKVAICKPGRKLLPGIQSAGTLISGLPRLQYCEKHFCLLSCSLWYSAQADEVGFPLLMLSLGHESGKLTVYKCFYKQKLQMMLQQMIKSPQIEDYIYFYIIFP